MASPYDLKQRTLLFASSIRLLIRRIPKHFYNFDDCKQVLRSSGSVGANYREADEAVSKDDFSYRIKICRKEAKETIHWLELIVVANPECGGKVSLLLQEATELRNILSAIIKKADGY